MINKYPEFSSLIRKYRLKSTFKTLVELGDALSEKGFIFEDSTYSRWENGSRIPRDRKVLLVIIRLFIDRGAINLEEANEFMAAAKQGYLTRKEEAMFLNEIPHSPFQAPRDILYFSGRREIISIVKRKLLKGNIFLIHGIAGSGKTTLAIKLCHLLRDSFPDGVIWIRMDTSTTKDALMFMAESYGLDISQVNNLDTASSQVRSLLSNKKVLIVLDNVDLETNLEYLMPNSQNNSLLITSRYKNLTGTYIKEQLYLRSFENDESLELMNKILEKRFFNFGKNALLAICEQFGNLPLAISIISQQLKNPYINLEILNEEIKQEGIKLLNKTYENKTLLTAISLVYNRLDSKTKSVFSSMKIFGGKDFSLEAISYINEMTSSKTRETLGKLIGHSLVEYSSLGRYRLHPVIKLFVQSKRIDKNFYERALEFYCEYVSSKSDKIKYFFLIQAEICNILKIAEEYLALNNFTENFFILYNNTTGFLWYKGYWEKFRFLNEIVLAFAFRKNNFTAELYSSINLSTVYYWQGELALSEKYARRAFRTAMRIKNDYFQAQAEDRLGKIYQLKRKFIKSSSHLRNAFVYFRNTEEYEKTGNVLRHIGEGYLLQGGFKRAEKYMNLALREYLKINDLSVRYMYKSLINSHLGIAFLRLNNLSKAEKLFKESLSFEKRVGGKAGTKIGSMLGLGLINGEKDNGKAKKYFQEAYKEALSLGLIKEIDKLNVFTSVLQKELLKNVDYKRIFNLN